MARDRKSLAATYRPRTFGAVRGQRHPVRVLSELIKRNQTAYNILLHGSVGSGKTSLVRLFEMALNCDQPTADGSPCGECQWCHVTDRARVGLQEYNVSSRGGDFEDFDPWLKRHYRTPTTYKWQVLFFDEAHSLKNDATDSLLKKTEEPIDNVIFCFATTEYEKLRPALRSRTIQLEVRPLSAAESIQLLREVADRERIEYEDEALALLAGISAGQPRDLLTALDEVSRIGQKVTEQYVREFLDIDHKPALLAYFRALADGDFTRQTEAIENWRETTIDKAKWISSFLLALYYSEICGSRLIIDPIIESITTERAAIIKRFQARFGVASARDLAPYWRTMLEFWNDGVPQDEASALLKLTLFHLLVCDDPETLIASADRRPRPVQSKQPTARTETAPATSLAFGPGQEFLTPNGARTILDLASYLIQEYGVGFNVAFEIYPQRLGAETEAAARVEIERFLGGLIEMAGAETPFAHLTLLERYEGTPRGLVVAHVPALSGESARDWEARIRAFAESWSSRPDIVSLRLCKKIGVDWKFHWDEALNLCGGLWENRDPSIPFDRLRAPRWVRRLSGPVAGGILLASDNLMPQSLEQAAHERMAPLSAVADEAWEHVRKKWELLEYNERVDIKRKRAAAIAEIEATHGADTDLARAKIAELKDAWPIDPHDRPRKWTPWPRRERLYA